MRVLALLAWLAGTGAVGCQVSEPPGQRCDRARTAANTAVSAYIGGVGAALDRIIAGGEARQKRLMVADAALDRLAGADLEVGCGAVAGLATERQPDRGWMEDVVARGIAAVRAGVKPLDTGEPVNPAVADRIRASSERLDAVLARSSELVPFDRIRRGARWSPAQRAYLASVEAAWCELADLALPVIREQRDVLGASFKAISHEGDAALDELDRLSKLVQLAGTVRDSLDGESVYAVPVPQALVDDPGFEVARLAIHDLDRCGVERLAGASGR